MKHKRTAKRAALIAGILAAAAMLGSCGNDGVVEGEDGLLGYAQDYYSNESLVLSGTTYNKDRTLAWYTNGLSLSSSCRAMTFRNQKDGTYEFVSDEHTKEYARDIWSCSWNSGVALLIENEDCRTIRIISGDLSTDISISETPQDMFLPFDIMDPATRVQFFDKRGIRIT